MSKDEMETIKKRAMVVGLTQKKMTVAEAIVYEDTEPDNEFVLGPCGCTDYHMADCPTMNWSGEDQLGRDFDDA